MNLHVREIKNRKKTARGKTRTNGNQSGMFSFFKVFILGALMIFAIVNLRISINEKTEKLNREAARLTYKIHEIDREIEHLKIDRERLTRWPHIKNKIKTFSLALRFPNPVQVAPLVIVGSDEGRLRQMGSKEYKITKR